MRLKGEQKPHTLFITCSDSRVDPNMITGTLPGELFIIRNIANLVPPDRETPEYVATTSAVEYALLSLGVGNIIVCGHSNCGGCALVLQPEIHLRHLPHTRKWMELARSVGDQILRNMPDHEPEARAWAMEQANVVAQMKNLLTYPCIYQKV
ncbi:MAG: carbonic anhydrase, partial [Candidatus Atribacteria bacterium]